MRLTTAALALPLLAGGCASNYQPPLAALPAAPPAQEVTGPVALAPLPPPPVPDSLPELPPENAVRAAVTAQAAGVVKPRRSWFRGAAYFPPYHHNNAYLIYTAEGETTGLRFRPREVPSPAVCSDGGHILSVAYTQGGEGAAETWTLDLKARMVGGGDGRIRCRVSTNFAPRGYVLMVQTVPQGRKHHILSVEFDDPYGLLDTRNAVPSRPVCRGTDQGYRLTGDPGAFGLVAGSVSNDGVHTCIRFPPSAAFDLPAVWLVEGDGERPATPPTINGAYVIDGVPPVIELRTDHATLRIERLERKTP